jgi:mannose-6-phosphate isomerase-like protein (cupin superfamily)
MKIVEKQWGREIIFAHTDRYVGKILILEKDKRLSRQYHNFKDETFYVQSGTVVLEIGDKDNLISITMNKGESYHCPAKTIHRMIPLTDVEIFEVSTTELDDIVRIEDDYGRV